MPPVMTADVMTNHHVTADVASMAPDVAVVPPVVPRVVPDAGIGVHDYPAGGRGQGRRCRKVGRLRRRRLGLDGGRHGHAEGQHHEQGGKKVADDLHVRLLWGVNGTTARASAICGPASSATAVAGRRTVKVDPRPRSLTHSMTPP
jgi:hypothetical protein